LFPARVFYTNGLLIIENLDTHTTEGFWCDDVKVRKSLDSMYETLRTSNLKQRIFNADVEVTESPSQVLITSSDVYSALDHTDALEYYVRFLTWLLKDNSVSSKAAALLVLQEIIPVHANLAVIDPSAPIFERMIESYLRKILSDSKTIEMLDTELYKVGVVTEYLFDTEASNKILSSVTRKETLEINRVIYNGKDKFQVMLRGGVLLGTLTQ
jgi:hypothetical protein